MHRSERPSPPPAGPPGVFRVGPGSSPADLEAAAAFLSGDRIDDGPRKGPWFYASYDGECSGCDGAFYEGELIRADGEGGWEAQECCGDGD